MRKIGQNRKLSRSLQGSEQLNQQLLTYAQLNNISGVSRCLQRGANPLYQNGAFLLISATLGYKNLVKLALSIADYSLEQLQLALRHSQRQEVQKMIQKQIDAL